MSSRIQTTYWAKPIPLRQFDWEAWYDGDEPNDEGQMDTGYGATEQEAIADLVDNYPRGGTEREASAVLAFIAASLVVAMVAVICGVVA